MKPRISRVFASTRALVSNAVQAGLPRATEQLTQALELARQLKDALRDAAIDAQQASDDSRTRNERGALPKAGPLNAAEQYVAVPHEASSQELSPVTPRSGSDNLTTPAMEPPVVARLLIEIRSDGSRTIARGALQDELSGEKVAIEAHGSSPLELAAQLTKQLAKTVVSAPFAIASARSSFLSGKTALTGKKERP